MNLKKLIACACTLTCFVVFAAGCGGGKTEKAGDAKAADKWPQKPVTLIVTHGAGGDTDYNARLLARLLEKELGQPVVVNNVTGANGSIALTQYKDEKSDGYTFIATNTIALASNEATGLTDYGYTAFEPVSIYGRQCGENILVRADAPYQNLKEFMEASKQKPGQLKLGIAMGGSSYVAAIVMENKGGAQFATVDAGDGGDRMTALIGGHIDATIAPYTLAKEYIQNGNIKSLGTLLSERSKTLPDIPTAKESGVEDLVVDTMYGVLAPKGTDAEIVQKLNQAILKVVNENPAYKEAIEVYNFQAPWALNVEDTAKELKRQREHFMDYSKYLK